MKNVHLIPTDKPSRLHLGNSGLVLFDLNFNRNTINSQNIYITNSEEIKEGDYVLSGTNTMIKCMYPNNVVDRDVKKITLTTDQELINDDVQAIDDEFLEWFVKNPSCESVEIENTCLEVRVCDCAMNENCLKPGYKIIIPKQKLTLEEAAKEYFRESAKWQQERMYSEEELLQALNIGFTSTDETWVECVAFAKEQFKKK